MKLKISWENPNSAYDDIQIFRSETPFDSLEGMTPIATLPFGSPNFYEDEVPQASRYFYRTRIRSGSDYSVGSLINYDGRFDTGPGKASPIYHYEGVDVFEIIRGEDFISEDELIILTGLTSNKEGGSIPDFFWCKVRAGGKILFFPLVTSLYRRSTSNNPYSYESLNQAGLIHGPYFNPIDENIAPRIIDKLGYQFYIRAPYLVGYPSTTEPSLFSNTLAISGYIDTTSTANDRRLNSVSKATLDQIATVGSSELLDILRALIVNNSLDSYSGPDIDARNRRYDLEVLLNVCYGSLGSDRYSFITGTLSEGLTDVMSVLDRGATTIFPKNTRPITLSKIKTNEYSVQVGSKYPIRIYNAYFPFLELIE